MNLSEIESYIRITRGTGSYYNDDVSRRYTTPKIAMRKTLKDKVPILIDKKVVDNLLAVQKMFKQISGWIKGNDITNQRAPIIFALGQDENVITHAELIKTNGGCGYMTNIHSDSLSEAMYGIVKRNLFMAGIARVGFFDTYTGGVNEGGDFGSSLINFRNHFSEVKEKQGICLLSLGKYGIMVHFPDKRGVMMRHSYKILTERKKK